MFIKEVQDQFIKAGWYEGRTVQRNFNKIKNFDRCPLFLQEFLYEYGNLEVKTLIDSNAGLLDFKILAKKRYSIANCLKMPRYYGNVYTIPFAFYYLDGATIECDLEGRVYMSGEIPCLISNDFKTGIEKIIMEDYTDIFQWDPENNEWVQE
jgi:hypothetical protein